MSGIVIETVYAEVVTDVSPRKGDKGDQGDQGPKGDTGDQGPKGDQGDDGTPGGPAGESAYQTAVDGGFVGTEEEWLATLVGGQGPPGDDGPPGADGADATAIYGDPAAVDHGGTGSTTADDARENLGINAALAFILGNHTDWLLGTDTDVYLPPAAWSAGILTGGLIRQATGAHLKQTYTQTAEPADLLTGSPLIIELNATLMDTNAPFGPSSASGLYGPRAAVNLEGITRVGANQSTFSFTPLGFADMQRHTNVVGSNRVLTPGWHYTSARTTYADTDTVTLHGNDIASGTAAFVDAQTFMTAHSGTLDGTTNSYELISALSMPFILGNAHISRRTGFKVNDLNQYLGTPGSDLSGNLGASFVPGADSGVGVVDEQYGVWIPHLTQAVNRNVGIYNASATVEPSLAVAIDDPADTLPITASVLAVTAASVLTLTGTPTIAAGLDGQRIRVVNVGANAFGLQDVSVFLRQNESATVEYSSAAGAWLKAGLSNPHSTLGGPIVVGDGTAAHGKVTFDATALFGTPASSVNVFANATDTKPIVSLINSNGVGAILLGAGGTTPPDLSITRTGPGTATAVGAFTLPSPVFTGTPSATGGVFSVVDGTVAHGLVSGVVTTILGAPAASLNVFNNATDAKPAIQLLTVAGVPSLGFGAGGVASADVTITRTGAAAATATGVWTFTSAPVVPAGSFALFDASGGIGSSRTRPASTVTLPMRPFRLALGARATTLVKEANIGDSLSELWATDPENLVWLALYESAMANRYNPLPRTAGYLVVNQPAGSIFPQLVHWDTVTGTQTSVPQPAFIGVGTIVTDLAANTFKLIAHGYANNTPIEFTGLVNTTGTGLANLTPVYVVNAAADAFQVSTTRGGSPIDLGGGIDSTVSANSIGAPWGRSMIAAQACEVTRTGDGVTIFYTAQHAGGDTATVTINGSTVGTINSTDASVPASPGFDSGRSVSYANPAGYGPMDIVVTNTSGSGTFLLDGCYISAGNLTTGYRLDRVSHGGWGMTEFLAASNGATLQHIKNQLPQLVSINLGANDYLHHAVTVTQFATLLTNMIAAVRAQYGSNPLPSIRYIFEPKIDPGSVTATDWDTTYRAAARAVCEGDGNVAFIDWYEALGTYGSGAGNDQYAIAPNDEVHPVNPGHYTLAQSVVEATIVGHPAPLKVNPSFFGALTLTDGATADGKILASVSALGTGINFYAATGDTTPRTAINLAAIAFGPGGSAATDVAFTRTGAAAAAFTGTITLTSPLLAGSPQVPEGVFSIVDGTAGHGKILASVSAFGPGLNIYGNSGDTIAKVALNSTGLFIGPGGSTATDFAISRTGVAAGAITGVLTITSPIINTGVSGSAIDPDSTFAANSDTILPTQKAVKTAVALLAPLASPAFTGLFSLMDGTAAHGEILGSVSVVGPGFNLYGTAGDSTPRALLNLTTLAFGPGGSTATDVKVVRTGVGTATLTGTFTIPSPTITGTLTAAAANFSGNVALGDATTDTISVYGVAGIAQRSGAAQVAVAATTATQTTPWGFSTAAQANGIVTLVNELRAWAVAQGFIKGSA